MKGTALNLMNGAGDWLKWGVQQPVNLTKSSFNATYECIKNNPKSTALSLIAFVALPVIIHAVFPNKQYSDGKQNVQFSSKQLTSVKKIGELKVQVNETSKKSELITQKFCEVNGKMYYDEKPSTIALRAALTIPKSIVYSAVNIPGILVSSGYRAVVAIKDKEVSFAAAKGQIKRIAKAAVLPLTMIALCLYTMVKPLQGRVAISKHQSWLYGRHTAQAEKFNPRALLSGAEAYFVASRMFAIDNIVTAETRVENGEKVTYNFSKWATPVFRPKQKQA